MGAMMPPDVLQPIEEDCEPFSKKPQGRWHRPEAFPAKHWVHDVFYDPHGWTTREPHQHRNTHYLVYISYSTQTRLEQAISEASAILSLQQDWDDNGAAPVDHLSWESAVSFLRSMDRSLRALAPSSQLVAPEISPCPDGSVDMLWDSERFKLLINFHRDDPPDIYGESKDGGTIHGPATPDFVARAYQLMHR